MTAPLFHRSPMGLILIAVAVWGGQPARAQTVQLPSFHRFYYSGSVLVPDRGNASLGGVSRSYTSRASRRGAGTASGGGVNHAGASVHVTIIDHDEIDRQIRGLDAPSQPAIAGGSSKAVTNGEHAMPRRRERDLRRADATDPNAEGKALVRYARRQYRAGNRASAYDAYQLSFGALSPELAALAKAEFDRVFPSGRRPSGLAASRFATRPRN